MRLLSAAVALALLAGACDDTPAETPDTSGTVESPGITAIVADFEGSWDPAWVLLPDMRGDFDAALAEAGMWALLPTGPPITDSTLSADVRITRTVPSGQSGVEMVLRRVDRSVFVSIEAIPVGDRPTCDSLLDDLGYPAWATQVIRGTTGCSLLVEGAVSYLRWTEAGQDFHTEFSPEVDLSDLVSWLDTWTAANRSAPVPDGGEEAALRARAMMRAWNDWVSDERSVCVQAARVSPELRSAIDAEFPIDVEYYESKTGIETDTSEYRCTDMFPERVEQILGDVVGVDVWVIEGVLAGRAVPYLFRWNGSQWIDTTPEETGVTVTSAVT